MENKKFNLYECIEKFPFNNLKKLYKKETDSRMSKRLLALYHLEQGKKLREVIEITLSDETAIRRWVKKYTKFGLTALYEEDGRGSYTKLPKNQESKAKEEILSAAVEAWTTFTDKEGVVNRLCSRDWAKIQY